jgi:hypothetical protein
MKNLTEFKKYLATPEASLRMISLEWLKNGEWVNTEVRNPNFRAVKVLQTNAVAFADETTKSGKSWLWFGKASEWAFDEASQIAVNLSGGTRITYKWANTTVLGN